MRHHLPDPMSVLMLPVLVLRLLRLLVLKLMR
jgi:hypothetical protein